MQRRLVARTFHMTQRNKWVFSRFLKVSKVTKLTMLSGSEFQTVGGATEKARLAKTVRVTRNGQPRCVRSVATSLITLDIWNCTHILPQTLNNYQQLNQRWHVSLVSTSRAANIAWAKPSASSLLPKLRPYTCRLSRHWWNVAVAWLYLRPFTIAQFITTCTATAVYSYN